MEFFQAYQRGQGQQRISQLEEMKLQQQERAIQQEQTMGNLAQQYMRTGNPRTIGQIASMNPQRAEGLMKIKAQVMENQARGVKSVANTWNNTPESQRAELYPVLMKRFRMSGGDASGMPLEHNKDTAQQINETIRSESLKADQFLSEEKKYGEIPKGHYLETETGQLRRMEGYQPGMEREKPPSGWEWTPQGTLAAIPGGPAVKVPAEQAGKIALIKTGRKDLRSIKQSLFKDGELDKKKILALNAEIPFTDIAPGRIGELQDINSKLNSAIEAKLRLESGAAVPETEVRRAREMFVPNIFDNAQSARNKLNRLERFFDESLEQFQKGRRTQQRNLSTISDEQLLGAF